MKVLFKTAILGLILSGYAFLMGCEHTVAGVGKDMQNTGAALEDTAHNDNHH